MRCTYFKQNLKLLILRIRAIGKEGNNREK
jgi:hypothetical protein